jgi:hypothetical protein
VDKSGGRIIIRRSNENRTYRRKRAETHTKAFRQIIPAVNAWIWYTIHTHTQQYNTIYSRYTRSPLHGICINEDGRESSSLVIEYGSRNAEFSLS